MELVGRNGPKAADLAKLREQRPITRDRFFAFDDNSEKSPHEKEPTSPTALFTF